VKYQSKIITEYNIKERKTDASIGVSVFFT
jgi:hypothetical protein